MRQKRQAPSSSAEDAPPLTKAQARELDRRLKDLKDRTRYLLVSRLGPRFVLYYNVTEDTYGFNDPLHATLFKRREAAVAIRNVLRPGVRLIRCRVTTRGRLFRSSIRLPPGSW